MEGLAISGGGIKGAAILGAIKVLEERGILKDVHTFAATSVGGIIAVLLASGFVHSELYQIFTKINFDEYLDLNVIELFERKGLADGERLMRLLTAILKRKNIVNPTLSEFKQTTGKTVLLTGSNLTTGEPRIFGPATDPDMPLLLALRISISYPIFFTPVEYQGGLYIDGGVYTPYPIQELHKSIPIDKTLGILIDSERVFNRELKVNDEITDFEGFLATMVRSLVIRYCKLTCTNCLERTIGIDLTHINAMHFGVSLELKEEMHRAGTIAAQRFFEKSESK